MKLGKTQLKRLFTDLLRKRITDGMMDTLIESIWRDQWPDEVVIEFTASSAPAVEDYNTKYFSKFRNHPKTMLLIDDDDGNEVEFLATPTRFRTAGVLMRIAYDLGDPVSGRIILYK